MDDIIKDSSQEYDRVEPLFKSDRMIAMEAANNLGYKKAASLNPFDELDPSNPFDEANDTVNTEQEQGMGHFTFCY